MFFPFGPTAPGGGAGSDTFQVLGEVHYLLPSGYWQMGLSLVAHLDADNEEHLEVSYPTHFGVSGYF